MDTQALLQERETMKSELMRLHNRLRTLPSTNDEEIELRNSLIAQQSTVNQRLGELKRLLKAAAVAIPKVDKLSLIHI